MSPICRLNHGFNFLIARKILHLLVILGPHGLIMIGNIMEGGYTVPMINFPTGGLYCSMTTVETGKASVLERKMARTATAMKYTSMMILSHGGVRNLTINPA